MNYKSENIPGSVDEVIKNFKEVEGVIKKYPGLTCIAGVLLVLVGFIVSAMSYKEYKRAPKIAVLVPAATKKNKAEDVTKEAVDETKEDVPEEGPKPEEN